MTFRQTVKKFFSPVWQEETKGYYTMAILSAIFGSFYELFNIIILEKISLFVELKDSDGMWRRISMFFLSMIVYFVYKVIYKRYNLFLVAHTGMYLDAKYLKKYLHLTNNYTEQLGTGRMISILKTGLLVRCDLLRKLSADYLRVFLSVLFALSYIFTKGRYFAGYTIILILICVIWIYYFVEKPIPWRRKAKELNMEFDRLVVRWIMSKFEILQSHQYEQEVQKDRNINTKWAKVKVTEKTRQSICYDGMSLITSLMTGVLISYIAWGVYQGIFQFSSFILFSSLSVLISQKLSSLADIAKDISDNFIHVTKLRDKIDDGPTLELEILGKDFYYNKGDIVLKDISFGYEDNTVFEDFSLELKGGTKTAFVGESGGGKTTLIKLLAGYLRPDSGEIIIDGQKLSEVKLTDYYRHIGYLTQEPSVFDGTVWENLIYGLPETSSPSLLLSEKGDHKDESPSLLGEGLGGGLDKKIHTVISLAKCEFIYEFEHGLQTEIGERGVRLSGGQKQRLAIAKIMLKNPNIILLDEPTSALDSFNEELVTEALHNLFKGRTVIVVAHRLQTVKNADRILYIEGGQVIEDGTHTSLIKKNGNYKKMLDLQSGF